LDNINVPDDRIDRLVDELFAGFRHGEYCRNPITGGGYIHGIDPIAPQKEAARRALVAREWFAINGPSDAQPLPLNQYECEEAWQLRGPWKHIVQLYARSLENINFDVKQHPRFADYVSGVLWEAACVDSDIGWLPDYPEEIAQLEKRFPPAKLVGLGPGFFWEPPPELYVEIMLPPSRRSIAYATS
jgi:hypothetical protein